VNALRRIHAALVPDGLVIDTQPLSPRPTVESGSGELGTLDMREWARTIDTIDARIATTIRDGLFSLREERRFVVSDTFGDGGGMLDVVRAWMGTRIPGELAERAAKEDGPVSVHQDVRLRVLQAR
jgi:hypothetical protein